MTINTLKKVPEFRYVLHLRSSFHFAFGFFALLFAFSSLQILLKLNSSESFSLFKKRKNIKIGLIKFGGRVVDNGRYQS
jgi:hypothetical protein